MSAGKVLDDIVHGCMMRLITIVALCTLLLIPQSSAADQSVGPWVGIIEEGEWNSHYVQNYKSGFACLVPPGGGSYRHYTFVLESAVPTDTLVLRVGGVDTYTVGGVAVYQYIGYQCQSGFIYVYGLDVLATNAYTIQFIQGHGTGLSDTVDRVIENVELDNCVMDLCL